MSAAAHPRGAGAGAASRRIEGSGHVPMSCENDEDGRVVYENHVPVGTQRYQVCAACARVLVNVDGLHRPNIAQLLAEESLTLW